ncbi:MAG TPA: hypothetical protein VHI93_07225 [Candidatus Thermoplasmatota archaeon]|nr:hypothetical protein [Candidatus Thermoplasmatota archaeon]
MTTLWGPRGHHAKKDPAARHGRRRKDGAIARPGDGHEAKLPTKRRKRAT